jgi:hypothetical protein
MMGGLLAFVGSMLVEESLVTNGLLVVVGGMLIEEALCGTLVKKLLTTSDILSLTSSFLLEKVLTKCSPLAGSFLVFVGGTLANEGLTVSGLLLFASS